METKEQDCDVKYFYKVPYRWNFSKIFSSVWNPKEVRILPPKQFGIG
jgi:hypothetical protein